VTGQRLEAILAIVGGLMLITAFVGVSQLGQPARRGRREKRNPRPQGIVWTTHFAGVWIAHAPFGVILTVTSEGTLWLGQVNWPTGHVLKASLASRAAAEHWCESQVRS
jgi:amino acid transporter